jgi:hypothetical protein
MAVAAAGGGGYMTLTSGQKQKQRFHNDCQILSDVLFEPFENVMMMARARQAGS